jgi:hypothetical protein
MNQSQLDEAKAIVRADATGVGAMIRDGRYCALGGLAKAAGLSDTDLANDMDFDKAYAAVKVRFGIELLWAKRIWHRNDEYQPQRGGKLISLMSIDALDEDAASLSARREAVCSLLDDIFEEGGRNNVI